jgi:hypothetical protein
MSAAQYFDMLARLLKANPPPTADAPVIAKLAAIGIVPGQPFDPSHLDPAVAKGLAGSVSVALQKLQEGIEQKATTQSPTGHTANGWRILPMTVGNWTPKASRSTVRITTCCISTRGRPLPSTPSGPSRCTGRIHFSSRTRSIATPAGDFNLTLRMYWSKDKPISINDGSWVPPGARKLPQSPQ